MVCFCGFIFQKCNKWKCAYAFVLTYLCISRMPVLINNKSIICTGGEFDPASEVDSGVCLTWIKQSKLTSQSATFSVCLAVTDTRVIAKLSQVNCYYSTGKFILPFMDVTYCLEA